MKSSKVVAGIMLSVALAFVTGLFLSQFDGDFSETTVSYGEAEKPADQVDEELEYVIDNKLPPSALAGEASRSGHWATVMHHFKDNEYDDGHGHWECFNDGINRSVCRCCGSSKNLNVHHIKPFHLDPALECDPTNLVTLCREHHFNIGHKGNWKGENPNVCGDCDRMRAKLNPNRH